MRRKRKKEEEEGTRTEVAMGKISPASFPLHPTYRRSRYAIYTNV